MKHPKVLHPKHLPGRLPLLQTLLWYLFLDKIHAPGWVWGVMGTLMVLVWAVSIYNLIVEEKVELKELS